MVGGCSGVPSCGACSVPPQCLLPAQYASWNSASLTDPRPPIPKPEPKQMVDFHGELVLLLHWSLVNYAAVAKILKKHDKLTGSRLRAPVLASVLHQVSWVGCFCSLLLGLAAGVCCWVLYVASSPAPTCTLRSLPLCCTRRALPVGVLLKRAAWGVMSESTAGHLRVLLRQNGSASQTATTAPTHPPTPVPQPFLSTESISQLVKEAERHVQELTELCSEALRGGRNAGPGGCWWVLAPRGCLLLLGLPVPS